VLNKVKNKIWLIMDNSNDHKFNLPECSGKKVIAVFDAKDTSTDFGFKMVSSTDDAQKITERFSEALQDDRDQRKITHPKHDLIRQRVYQISLGYYPNSHSDKLRHDPVLKMSLGHMPSNVGAPLSSASTLCRFENNVSKKDIYRMSVAQVDSFIASYGNKTPEVIVLDFDHSEDKTHGEQEHSSYHGYYKSNCYLPLFVHEGLSGKLILSVLRDGKNATGVENNAIAKRLVKVIRNAWPNTHIILRGDSKFANPELMELIEKNKDMDFIFGLGTNAVLDKLAQPTISKVKAQLDKQNDSKNIKPISRYGEFMYDANTWGKKYRVIVHGTSQEGSDPSKHMIVSSLLQASPKVLYKDIYAQRGNQELRIKDIKNDLRSDFTACSRYLANYFRLLLSACAYSLIHSFTKEAMKNTPIKDSTPKSIIRKIFKLAVSVVETKGKIILHLPDSCPYKDVIRMAGERLFLVNQIKLDTS
jgi:hypothetical protein